MKKKSYARPIALLVLVVGAFHVAMFGLHPPLPPVAGAEVIWGELSDTPPPAQPTPELVSALCRTELPAEEGTTGKSPANVPTTRVRFEYRPMADVFINNGDSAQILMSQGSTITIGKAVYPLQQIAFTRAENTDERSIYLIHKTKKGKAAVVVVPLRLSENDNPTIDALWRYLPKHSGDHNSLDDLHVDINALLPHDRSFHRYPVNTECNEKLILLGLTSPVQMSAAQLKAIDKILTIQSASGTL